MPRLKYRLAHSPRSATSIPTAFRTGKKFSRYSVGGWGGVDKNALEGEYVPRNNLAGFEPRRERR